MGNPSRGAHGYALKAYGIVLQAKDDVKALFHCGPEYDVAFTHNSTAALNMVLKGLIHPGDGVLTTSWEHNAVLRPLYQLEAQGVSLAFIASDSPGGALQYDTMEERLTPRTKWFVCNHASNVTGNVLDLPRIKAFCQRHHLGSSSMYPRQPVPSTSTYPMASSRQPALRAINRFTGQAGRAASSSAAMLL